MPTLLCATQELSKTSAKAFQVGDKRLFVVKENQSFFAYLNNCPHRQVPLDWDNEQFLDYDEELIQCSTHGALFVINTGVCVSGPCLGDKLTKVEIFVEDEKLYLRDSNL